MQLIGDDDSDVQEIEHAAAGPHVASSRVVDQTAMERLACCARGPACTDLVPTDLVTLNCRHALCRSCYTGMGHVRPDDDSDDDGAPLVRSVACPTCRTAAPPHAHATNHGLVGQIENLTVRCKHAPACPAVYALGVALRNEAEHLSRCPMEPVEPCEGCKAPLLRGEEVAHEAACDQRTADCEQCGVAVPVATMADHASNGDREGMCAGMVPCPNGCEDHWHQEQPSSKSRRRNEAGDKTNGFTVLLRPADVAAHTLVCPCRPAVCPFAGCPGGTHGLMHHEVTAHLGRPKYMGAHMQGMMAILQAQQAGAMQREAALQTQIDALQRNPRMDPFPTYTRILTNALIHIPEQAATHPNFAWPRDYNRTIDFPGDVVEGISRIKVDLHGEAAPAKRSRAAAAVAAIVPTGRKLEFELNFIPYVPEDAPRIEPEVRQRPMGIAITVRRLAKPGDREVFMGVCMDAGTHLERFTAEFTNYANVARPCFDAFETLALKRLCNVEGALSAGHARHFSIGIELFEKLPAAAAQ